MTPFWNQLDGKSVPVLGLGDGIAHVLKAHLRANQGRDTAEAEAAKQAA